MTTCEQVQAQMLGYLYDLLDDVDKAAVDRHLAGCEHCQKALAGAKRQQRLLAAAAKTAFPNVQFERPKSTPVAADPAPAKRSRLSRFHFALAATIFLATGLALPAGWFGWKTSEVQRRLDRQEAALVQARVQEDFLAHERDQEATRLQTLLADSEKTAAKLQEEQQNKVALLAKQISDRQLQLSVVGPEVLQAGAEANYVVQTRNLQNEDLRAQLSARVIDQDGKVFFEVKDVPTLGKYDLHLPADLPLTPDKKLALDVVARQDGQPDRRLHQKIALAAPVYLTHLATDKPMYRPGETVHYRSLTLERFSLKPVQESLHLQYTITGPLGDEIFKQDGASRLRNVSGALVTLPDGKPVAGVGAGEFLLPPAIAGGEFTLTVREANNRFPEQQRKFIVNNFANPRMNKELDFTRKSYGPGQEVVAACSATFAEGGPVANRPVVATMFIDGKPYGPDGKPGARPLNLQTDALGKVNVRFKLPDVIERGQANLSLQFSDGGSVETLLRPIPIALKKLMVDFFPEGGDLIAGAPNRVYFQARTTLGKPAEFKGHVVDDRGQTVAAAVATLHDDQKPGVNQGMGRVAFTPEKGRRYELKIDEPTGMEGTYALPGVRDDGIVLQVAQPGKETLGVQVTSVDKDRNLLIGVYCRGRLLAHHTLSAKKGVPANVELKPALPTGGVFRVTVFEELRPGTATRLAPRAERLVYRAPANPLTLSAKPSQERYVPGDRVKLSLSTANEKGEPAPAVAMAAVVDKSVLTLADEKTFRGMPTHYFLSTEINRPEELEYADFLVSSDPKAPEALDLLLGTQGWRRFAEQNPEEFRNKHKEDADRLLLTMGQPAPVEVDLAKQEVQQLRDEYVVRLDTIETDRKQVQKSLADVQNPGGPAQAKIHEAQTAAGQAAAKLAEIRQEKIRLWQWFEALRSSELSVLGILVGVALISCGLILGFAKGWHAGRVYYAGAAAGALVIGLVLSFGSLSDLESARTAQPKFARDMEVLERAPADQYRRFAGGAKMDAAPKLAERETPLPAAKPAVDFADQPGMPFGGGMGGGQLRGTPLNAAVKDARVDRAAHAPLAPPVPAGAINDPNAVLKGRAPVNLRQEGLEAQAEKGAAEAEKLKKEEKQLDVLGENVRGLDRNAPEPRRGDAVGDMKQNMKAGDRRRMAEEERRAPEAGAYKVIDKLVGTPKAMAPGFEPAKKIGGLASEPAAKEPAFPEIKERGQALGGGGRGARGFGAPGGPPALGRARQFESKLEDKADQGRKQHNQLFDLAFEGKPAAPLPEPMLVREYAHVRPLDISPGERKDFVDTVFWHPAIVLPNGTVDVEFQLGDAVSTYQILVFGHTADGRIGSLTKTIEARLPFTLEPKLPLEVTAGDRIDMPVSVANNTPESRAIRMQLEASKMKLINSSEGKSSWSESLDLAANARSRSVFSLQPSILEGESQIVLEGTGGAFRDRVIRRVPVVPQGFPVVQSRSDLLEQTARQELVLPENLIPGTLKCQVQVFPSTLASLQKGLEGLLREPNGCFEQTSTSNYPNLLILDYLRESNQTKPELEKRARELLANGYAKLTSFECFENGPTRRRGYEWFGGPSAPHEALTAYGLLQFRDMARVQDVDKAMLERTKQYLMSRKDGKGGFKRNARALDSFGRAPADITNAYIVWSLTESGKEDDVSKELEALANQAKGSKDPYFLALVAISLINRDRTADAIAMLKKLVEAQKEDGHLDAERTSITGSGGRDLQIETTGLAVLGWLKANRPGDFNAATQKAIGWIGQQRGGYGAFGSTQSTILALKALIAYARNNKKTAEGGKLQLSIRGQTAAQLEFPAGAQDVFTLALPDAAKYLHTGRNEVQISITGQNQFPYTLACSYQVESPPSEPGCVVKLATQLDRTKVQEGEAVHLNVTLENVEDHGQSMTVAIIGLPAGLTLPEDMKQLKDHARLRENGAKPGLISAWETRGRELILYWRDLAPKQKIDVPIDLIARVPGEYTGPASRAYLYYNADRKNWIKPLQVSIKAKSAE